MKKAFSLLILFFFLFSNYSIGQNCMTGTDDPPGCLYDCKVWSAQNEPFSTDSALSGLNCGANGFTRWFKIRPSTSIVRISMNSFNCTNGEEVNVQVYNGSFRPVSVCTSFDANDFSAVLAASGLLASRDYSVRVETSEPTGCDFELSLDGIQTGPIQVSDSLRLVGDSLYLNGNVRLDSAFNIDNFNWTSDNPSIVINSGAGTQSITYSKPRFESGTICLEFSNNCTTGVECIDIPAGISSCDIGGDAFPGCDFDCKSFWAFEEQFTPNASTCSGNAFSKWLKVRMLDSTIRITADRSNCNSSAEFNVQLYDLQGNPLGPCLPFRNDNYLTQELVDTNLTFFEEYSILIESNTQVGCDFKFNFEGTQRFALAAIPNIRFFTSNGLRLDGAKVDRDPEATHYLWEIADTSLSILSGQGTSEIIFSNPNSNMAEVCVTPFSDCKVGRQKCQVIAISSSSTNFNPCCTAPDVPMGCTEAGGSFDFPCVICNLAGIYQGNNSGYPVGLPMSCGIPHNSAYVAVVADGSGVLGVTNLVSSCVTGEGLQLILWDVAGNELDCYSIGGTAIGTLEVDGLVPGGVYIIQIDGFNGDECDYALIVTEGQTGVLPDLISEIRMFPDTTLCPGTEVRFEVDLPANASFLEWDLPQNLTLIDGGGNNDLYAVCLVSTAGGGAIKVSSANACYQGVPAILPVVALPVPPSVWPPTFVCQSDMPWDTVIKGQTYTYDQFGGHDITVVTALGCDSVITFSLIPKVQIPGVLDTTIASGSCIFVGNDCYPAGNYSVVFPSAQANGCDSTLRLTVSYDSITTITSDFSIAELEICPGETTTFSYIGIASPNANYNWDFGNGTIVSGSGSGPYIVRFADSGDVPISLSVTEGGVTSATTTKVVNVYPSLLPLSLTCNSTVDEITYTWVNDPNVSNYAFNISTGQTGVQNGNSFVISNLNPNEAVTLEIEAESSFGCASITDIQTCVAQDCPTVTVSIDPVSDICLTANAVLIQLTGQAGNSSGTFEWTGIGVSSNGEFNPNTVGVGTHQITLNYTDGACVYSGSSMIQINETPVADFSINSPICEGEPATINFTGSASATANFNWDFGNGNIVSGSGLGPYQIEYADASTETITLSIEDNGCVSNVATQSIVVDEPLIPTVITCSSTVNSVSFSWDEVAGVNNYSVNVLTGQSGTQNGRTYQIDNLSPGEVVQIEVSAGGNSVCGSVVMSGDCIAQNCPPVTVDVTPVPNICLTPSTQPFPITVSAGNNSGTFSYSGNGVSNNGIFDPQMANIGSNLITVEYTDGNCTYTGSATYVLNQTPTATFDISSPICELGTATISYTGSGSNNAFFDWNFGVGSILNGSNSGPYEVSFPGSGIETVALIVEENGCASQIETNTIQVDEVLSSPVIVCQNAMLNEVSFEWNDDPNVQDYQVQVTSGQSGSLNGTVYTVSGLSPGELVTIEVIGNSANSCPSVSSSFTCESINCPPIDLTIEPVQDAICAGDSTIIQLVASNNSPTQLGTYVWSGGNVSADGKFNTTGLASGDYNVQVEYNEMGCVYQSSQIVTIESTPELNATVNSPIWFLGQTGSIDLNIMNGTGPYDIMRTSAGATINQLDSLAPGEYKITAIDQNGCSVEETFTISEGTYTVNPIHVICAGDRQPLSVFPGTGATFNWSPSFRLSCSDCSNPIANPGRTTVYTVTATLPSGQSASQNVVVVVLPSFICNGLTPQDDKEFAKLLSDYDVENISKMELENLEKEVANFYLEKEVKVVPNPTDGLVNIVTPEEIESIEVFDFSGKMLKSEKEMQINLSNFSKGVYFFKIKIANQMIIKKVILI